MEQRHNQFLIDLQTAKQRAKGFVAYDAKLKVIGTHDEVTLQQFGALQNCSEYFNQVLFNNSLSSVLFTLNKRSRSMGHYKPEGWLGKATISDAIPEININPAILHLPESEVMQTLVHELCHHAQQLYGHPGRRGYHNREFSKIMFSVGLMCSSTGMPGGKITGRAMADYAVEGGVFLQAFNEMPKDFLLPFKLFDQELAITTPAIANNDNKVLADKNKKKYSCLTCRINLWGKPDISVLCGKCGQQLK